MSSQRLGLNASYEQKCDVLKRRLRELESAVVAFSGGVDSAVVVSVAYQELNRHMIAVLGVSPAVPLRDRETAMQFCRDRNIPFQEIETEEFRNSNYTSNPENRCYFCKRELFETLVRLAKQLQFKAVVDGTNSSDLSGHRPGLLAGEEFSIVTPLVDAGFTKADVRRLAQELHLSEVASKPATACLASRVTTGIVLSPELLHRIDRAEDFVRSLGIQQVRVRHHDTMARIEVGRDEVKTLLHARESVTHALKYLGWTSVTLDLAGYRGEESL